MIKKQIKQTIKELRCPKCKAVVNFATYMLVEGATPIGGKYRIHCACGAVFETEWRVFDETKPTEP